MTLVVGNQLWMKCSACRQWVRVNKPIIGGLHFCLTDEEILENRKNNMTEHKARLRLSQRGK